MESVTSSNFKERVLSSSAPVAVDFWAEWCGPCKMMKPAVERLASEGADIVAANVDDCASEVMQYGIQGVPSVLVFRDGEVVKRFAGAKTYDQLKSELAEV